MVVAPVCDADFPQLLDSSLGERLRGWSAHGGRKTCYLCHFQLVALIRSLPAAGAALIESTRAQVQVLRIARSICVAHQTQPFNCTLRISSREINFDFTASQRI